MNRKAMMPNSLTLALVCGAAPALAQRPIRWFSQLLSSCARFPVVSAVMDAIRADGFNVERSAFQALGINTMDGLRLARTGTFDVT